jgi:hypothetical protein
MLDGFRASTTPSSPSRCRSTTGATRSGRNGATIAILLPQNRPAVARQQRAREAEMKGTVAQELARDGAEPFAIEMCFNQSATPARTVR